MPRLYTLSFENVTVSAAQDLFLVMGPSAGKLTKIHRLFLGNTNTTLSTSQCLNLRCRRLPATVTVGSGGTTSATPKPRDPGDTAYSTATSGTNNTTQATTSGTAVVLANWGHHLFNSFLHRFDPPIPVSPLAGFVFELLAAPTGTVNLSGHVELAEEG